MKKFFNIFIISFALVFSTSSFANKIGVIYDSGGKFDKSFNELAYRTAERVKSELGWEMIEFDAANTTQIERLKIRFIENSPSYYSLIFSDTI